jgi:hypothetical protein
MKKKIPDCYNCDDAKEVPTVMACPDCSQPEPEVGVGGTLLLLNDCYPVTVTHVLSKTRILVRRDEVIHGGRGEGVTFAVSANGEDEEFTLRKDGYWRKKGDDMRGTPAKLGRRHYNRCREF